MVDGGFGPDGYNAREIEALFDTYVDAIETEYDGDLEPYEGSFNRALFRAFARAVHENQEQDLETLYDSMFVVSASDEELTKLARQYGARRQPAVAATGVVEWSRPASATGEEETVPAGVPVSTGGDDPIVFETTEAATFSSSAETAQATAKAAEGGTRGNVGADRLTTMPSPPAGVSGVTNPQPTGDPSYTITDGTTQQTLGQDREEDQPLRERVLEGASIGGAATVRAVRDRIRSLDGTPSLTIYTNRQLTANANGNGLPELSTELVIWSPSATDADVAQAIHKVASIGERFVSGYNGTAASYAIEDDVLGQTRTIEWSEPTEIQLSVSLDVVAGESYVGDAVLKETVAEYIGGTLPDGSPAAGLSVGDDVIVDELERQVNSLTGVVGTATVTIDGNGDGTDDTTTRSDGLTAYEVASDEVVTIDATTDVTITTT
jgi:hypothetical protein